MKKILLPFPRRMYSIYKEYYKYFHQRVLEAKFTLKKREKNIKITKIKPKIICITQVKNESDIIEDWIIYHLYLFGSGSLVVMDDGSDDGTREILDRYAGDIRVLDIPVDSRGLYNKKVNISKIIIDVRSNCDFIVPLDADEFLCLEDSVDRIDILNYFSNLDSVNWGIYKFVHNYESYEINSCYKNPVVDITRFYDVRRGYDSQKVFLNAKFAKAVGEGQHMGYSDHANDMAFMTKLRLVHFNWRGLDHIANKCLKGAEGFDYWKEGKKPYGRQYARGVVAVGEGCMDDFVESIKPHGKIVFYDLLSKKLEELEKILT